MYTGLYEGAWGLIALCCISLIIENRLLVVYLDSLIAQLIFNISIECYTMYRILSGGDVSCIEIIIQSFFLLFV